MLYFTGLLRGVDETKPLILVASPEIGNSGSSSIIKGRGKIRALILGSEATPLDSWDSGNHWGLTLKRDLSTALENLGSW